MRPPRLDETRPLEFARTIRELAQGRSIASGQVELTPNTAATVVTNEIISKDCFPQLTPASASAAAEWAAGGIYVAAVANGSITIAHDNSATTGRLINWHAVGG